jgi:voltage-gated potassium channel
MAGQLVTPGARRVLQSLAVLATVMLLGGGGYYLLGHDRWTLEQAIYMSVITVSTVGFAELPGFHEVRGAHQLTGAVIVCGIGAVAYFQSTLTAFLVEGAIGHAWRRQRMKRQIQALSKHVVVAGIGSTGRHVVEELRATSTPFVAIDRSRDHLERVAAELGGDLLYIHGDATDDDILRDAGADRASGIVTTLNDDKANLFVTLSARGMNPTARIVARVIAPETAVKMSRAGANVTVSPNMIGGRRMATELLRPEIAAFFDEMLRDKQNPQLEEIAIGAGSPFAGKRVADLPPRRDANVIVLAFKDGDRFLYNPPLDSPLPRGGVLVVFGQASEVEKLRRLVVQPSQPG